jgi:hypothetical protein
MLDLPEPVLPIIPTFSDPRVWNEIPAAFNILRSFFSITTTKLMEKIDVL